MSPKFHTPTSKVIAFSLIVLCGVLIAACSYYKVNTVDPLSNQSIDEQLKRESKYFILHVGQKAYHIYDLSINNEKSELKAAIETLPQGRMFYKTSKPGGASNAYKFVYDDNGYRINDPTQEVHIYANFPLNNMDSIVTVPYSAIHKMEYYDTHVGTIVAISVATTAVALAALAIIVISTKSSCPFVYLGDGATYRFAGEMYGGAIYPTLERDDYMLLPNFKAHNDTFQLKIANELLEKQYTNLAQLMVANHPENTDVLIDQNGKAQTIVDPQSPISTLTDNGKSCTKQITKRDSVSYLFDESNPENNTVNNLVLSFKRPEHARLGKLILNAKNSFWLDFVYGKFNELFGVYYNTFAEHQRTEPASKLNQWSTDQYIPLSVYIQTKSGWKLVDRFNSIGPLAARDIVMPIDLSEVAGDEVKVKLECGFMFWEVDYAAMDFSADIPVEIVSLSPVVAIDENRKDVTKLVTSTDHQYLEQLNIGNVTTLSYKVLPKLAGVRQTVFLHSRGYYEYIREYQNLPNISYLRTFREKASFTRFARERYDAYVQNQDQFVTTLINSNAN